jgi:hypothetical protein
MEKLNQIRQYKAKVFQALVACSESLKSQLTELYMFVDNQETILMENLDLDID